MTTATPARTSSVPARTTLAALTGLEARLLVREWAPMLFAFVFPPMMMLVLAGVFANDGGAAYGGADATDYYIAAYLGVPLAALALMGLPTALAGYRERGVLRRFEASGLSLTAVVCAQALVTAGLIVLAAGLVLAVAAPVYGLPELHDPVGVALGFALGTAAMLSLGVVLGLLARTARSAQALGLLVFLPMWLLGGGGPPPSVMTDVMQQIAGALPMTHVTDVVRDAWLGTGEIGRPLALTAVWLVVGLVLCAWLLRRRPDRV
ncbi:MAG: ABC transporter permease [Actinomycetales bacterium]|nr:ABC transporter permease [Actinomycetales bacterium]